MSSSHDVGPPEGRCSIPPPPALKNIYFGIRHGHSVNNLEELISSSPPVGTTIHPLTDQGVVQAREAGRVLAEELRRLEEDGKARPVIAYTSDFVRARQTAQESIAACGRSVDIVPREELRERWFGELDNTIVSNYNLVWPCDMQDARSDSGYGCESVEQVVRRLKGMLEELEKSEEEQVVLLFSHADTVQILQTWLSGEDVRKFSQFRFKNGEVRRLLLDPSSLPPPLPIVLK